MKNVKTYSMFWTLKWYFLQNNSCDFFIILILFFSIRMLTTGWMTLLHGGWHCYMVDDIVTWWMTLLHGGWHCYMVVDDDHFAVISPTVRNFVFRLIQSTELLVD